jgi:hypothetical protein
MPDVPSPLEEELNKLETALRQLKQQYDIFFSGAMPRQPFETRKEVDLLVKRLGNMAMQRFSDRYRYNSIAGKYQTYCELWSKMLRMREEGIGPGGKRQAPPPTAPPMERPPAESVVFKSRFKDPTHEGDAFKTFYDRYVEARKSLGNGASGVSYAAFLKQIAQKTESIKAKSGCGSVSYSIVIKDGAVTLRAAPVKEKTR